MQRLTNKPCRAVIASARNNDRLLGLIERGEVAWHQLKIPDPASQPTEDSSGPVTHLRPHHRTTRETGSRAHVRRPRSRRERRHPTQHATCAAEAWPRSHLPGEAEDRIERVEDAVSEAPQQSESTAARDPVGAGTVTDEAGPTAGEP